MGVKNLMKLINKYSPEAIKFKKIDRYKNKTLGIDANLMIYKMIYAIRLNGYDIMKNSNNITHIHTLLQKLDGFRKYNIKPIFVFDSGFPKIKSNTLEIRESIRKRMQTQYNNTISDKDKKKYYFMKSEITKKEINDCKELITIFGYQIIDAKEEADSELANMSKNKQIDGIVSDDMDMLVFGGKILLKNFTVSDKKYIQEINLDIMLKKLGINQSQLIDISIMIGCDYCSPNSNFKGIGPIKSYEIVKMNNYNNKNDNTSKYFKNPPVTKNISIKHIKKVNNEKLILFLQKNGYTKNEISIILQNK
jgi:flap endonuclease-1